MIILLIMKIIMIMKMIMIKDINKVIIMILMKMK